MAVDKLRSKKNVEVHVFTSEIIVPIQYSQNHVNKLVMQVNENFRKHMIPVR